MAPSISHPPVVSRDAWLLERKKLLTREKELTKQRDRINAERRRLPMVKLEKTYVFEGPNGKRTLQDLFEGRRQLIVYHFMFDPDWSKGCPACTRHVNAIGDLSPLSDLDTSFVLVSRAPLAKLEAYKAEKGWKLPWVSAFGSDFNYDFHVTNDETVAPVGIQLSKQGRIGGKRFRPCHQGRRAWPQRLLPSRRGGVPHLLGLRTRHGNPHQCPQSA
jgi:predicted dithiol-disulfide oxidoreductase (DUF899 family)